MRAMTNLATAAEQILRLTVVGLQFLARVYLMFQTCSSNNRYFSFMLWLMKAVPSRFFCGLDRKLSLSCNAIRSLAAVMLTQRLGIAESSKSLTSLC